MSNLANHEVIKINTYMHKMMRKCFLFISILLLTLSVFSQNGVTELLWGENSTIVYDETHQNVVLSFKGATYSPEYQGLPILVLTEKVFSNTKVSIKNATYVPIKTAYTFSDLQLELVSKSATITSNVTTSRGQKFVQIVILPFRKTTANTIERLVSYELDYQNVPSEIVSPGYFKSADVNTSVLATGNWYKICIPTSGIYKITYDDLKSLGIPVDNINPKNVRVFGNGGGMLPQKNSAFKHDDLVENAISIFGEADNSFDKSDYVIFYGGGPNKWSYNQNQARFEYVSNIYSDESCYFITTDKGVGKRVQGFTESAAATNNTSSYGAYVNHEVDLFNDPKRTIKSGRIWWGEDFSFTTSRDFSFTLTNLISTIPISITTDVLGRATTANSFNVKVNGVTTHTHNLSGSSFYYADTYGRLGNLTSNLNVNSSNVAVNITYSRPNSSASGFLNYIEINYRASLNMAGDQLAFRDMSVVGTGEVTNYSFNTKGENCSIWDITDPTNVKSLANGSGTLTFKSKSDNLTEFIAFNNQRSIGYLSPVLKGRVTNQNLHAMETPEMVIVVHPNFLASANRLASHKNSISNVNTKVVTTTQIYNEFSSGAQDASAIKEFMRMFYTRANGNEELMPKHLLLFGDGSYDNKNRVPGNKNFIPTYQSRNSNSPTKSYVSDDYFGLLDNTEGVWLVGQPEGIDINIGRLPVQSSAQANAVVDKIIQYESTSAFGKWRNKITLIADDEDSNIHFNQVEDLVEIIQDKESNLNIQKIYFDSYIQASTPGGGRYPEAQDRVNRNMDLGNLILNYSGHGGEIGLSHERVIGLQDINSWSNADNLAMVFTATCSFSRFDDPEKTSAGEQALLSTKGGAVALFTTVRLVYASTNFTLNSNFYKTLTETSPDQRPTLGELFRTSKNLSGTGIVNNRNFTLLGDPSIVIAFPKLWIETTSINGTPVSASGDSLVALEKVTVSGQVKSYQGANQPNFNGIVDLTVYDKPQERSTIGNDPSSNIATFKTRQNIVYQGKATAKNGTFNFEFIVPKDISYADGFGRFSLYASNGEIDAGGYYDSVKISGNSTGNFADKVGPEITVFLNDENFAPGGLTNSEPVLLVNLSDSSGINTTGFSIGHDITAIVTDSKGKATAFVLNDYYEASVDDFTQGKIKFPLSELAEGEYTMKVKAWDVANNSGEQETSFTVANNEDLSLAHVLNYPNPFTTNTEFQFEHNKPGDILDVQVQVFTVSGKLVKSITKQITSPGTRVTDIKWNGLDDFGDKIGKGVYVYRLKVRSSDGKTADKYEKLVILN
jgi:hypothetical protein